MRNNKGFAIVPILVIFIALPLLVWSVLSKGTFDFRGKAAYSPVPAPVGLTPTNGATVKNQVVFAWKPTPGAINYGLQLCISNSRFTCAYTTLNISSLGNITKYTMPTDQKLSDGKYNWILTAKGADNAVSKDMGSFTVTGYPIQVILTPTKGSMVHYGVDYTSTKRLTFTWQAVPGADSYSFILCSYSKLGFCTDKEKVQDKPFLGDVTQYTINQDLTDGKYQWWVVATYRGQAITKTPTPFTFTHIGNPAFDSIVPAAITPINGGTYHSGIGYQGVSSQEVIPGPLTLKWQAVQGADNYNLFICVLDDNLNTLGNCKGTIYWDRKNLGNVTQYVIPDSQDLTDGKYQWWVTGTKGTLRTKTSVPATFQHIGNPDLSTTAPALFYPLEASGDSPIVGNVITFKWSAPIGAGDYSFVVCKLSTLGSCGANEMVWNRPTLVGLNGVSYEYAVVDGKIDYSKILYVRYNVVGTPNGKYQWWVRAYKSTDHSKGQSPVSQTGVFTVTGN